MNKGIAFAGNLIVDQIKFIERYPAPSTLTTITGMENSMGGLVCNCIVDIAKLDPTVPLKAIGMVGSDGMGDFILEQLARHPSIDTAGVLRAPNGPQGGTSFTDVMTQPDGARTFFQYRGANALLGPEHFDLDGLSADILHIGYILLLDRLDGPDPEYPTALCRILDAAQKRGIRTSIDIVSEESERFAKIVPPALKYTDYCIINEIEAGRTTGIPLYCDTGLLEENFLPCLEKLRDLGVSRWVVIHTKDLSCGLDVQTGQFYREPSWSIPPGFKKSSVGAGDAFAAGVLLGAYQGLPMQQTIHLAGAVAAYSLSSSGASDAIKPLDTLLAEMEAMQA